MRISEPSFTDSGIDATGKIENQTCTRVDGRSAPSTLSLPPPWNPEPRTLNPRGSLRGLAPSCERRRELPENVSDAANGQGLGASGGTPERVKGSALARAKRSLV